MRRHTHHHIIIVFTSTHRDPLPRHGQTTCAGKHERTRRKHAPESVFAGEAYLLMRDVRNIRQLPGAVKASDKKVAFSSMRADAEHQQGLRSCNSSGPKPPSIKKQAPRPGARGDLHP